MKIPTMLVKAVLHNAAMDLDLSVERDVRSLEHRCKHEGFSFLTITLPTLSDSLERGLEAGSFTCPSNFRRHGRLPRFLGGFFKRVFTLDGELRHDSCPYSVFWIRQICRFFKKPKIECSPDKNRQAIKHFREVEGELRRMTSQIERKDTFLDEISRRIWAQVFPELDYLDLVCHHGPGVTADRYLSNERNRIRHWYQRSELTYPSDLHCFPNYGVAARASDTGAGIDKVDGPNYVRLKDEFPVRVVFVPKTLTAPRVIAIEPSNVQFMQQSLKDVIYSRLESHCLTNRSIRFRDQTINQRLAQSSSIDKRLATLDLKDASDRVHLHLVQRIFKNSGLLEYLEDARSLHATLPDGSNIVLTKYASMGSALCFPVEAMVFYTLIQSAMHQLDGRRPSSRSIRDYSRQIDIYGDDIIIPVDYTDVVVSYLESYALKVNINKSFRFSNFRESCGADYYKGIPVNPVYARTVPHDDLRHWGAEEVMSWAATADLCYIRGMWKLSETIRNLLSRVVRRTIPKSSQLGSGLFFYSFFLNTDLRYNRDLCSWKQQRIHYDPIKRKDSIDGDELACLNKWGQAVYARTASARFDSRFDTFGDRYRIASILQDLERRNRAPECASNDKLVHGGTGSSISDRGVCRVQDFSDWYGSEIPTLPSVPVSSSSVGPFDGSDRIQRERESVDICLTDPVQSDPLYYLSGDISGIDFEHSTKRGGFKSKRRWVSLAG